MKESHEKQISFPKISSAGIEFILEYIYTGSIKEESLTKDNMIETFYAANYFQLVELENFITKTFKIILKKNCTENCSPELLSKFAEKIPLIEDNIFLNLLVEMVAVIPLNNIEFGRLSISGLQYLLSCTYDKDKPFATPEYEVFRYGTNGQCFNSEKGSSYCPPFGDGARITVHLDMNKRTCAFTVNGKKYSKVLDWNNLPSKLYPVVSFNHPARLRIEPHQKCVCSKYVWDELECGSNALIEDNGKIVCLQSKTKSWRNVRVKMMLEGKSIFEWDVIIEKACVDTFVGVCAPENLSYEFWAGRQPTGWVLSTNGHCFNHEKGSSYCPPFGDGARITVHLDMNKRTCAFTVNGTKYPEVSAWNNLPPKLYPTINNNYEMGCLKRYNL
ncbi:concanavalin A-like lectin/glucanase domain-containing protein [Rhizophagus clarus]|uniref:Concanavalin A-like lectin/glucanase domain-containing protein n=1 Tax=Rhizophagus clarus TaxID=94130 RepID=A0A8H3M4B7_9GLOM|nr:concanavalin A-like lectin/glucanase domain-containing protein [Rhizophagus clarus]